MPIYNGIINQKGTPAFFSDIFANRPAFGYAGRVFISTDTGAIYEDTGSAWTLIADAGAGTTGTLQQVTTNGNTTTLGIVVNGISINNGAGTGTFNTAIGSTDSLALNTTGANNIAVGYTTLSANTTGSTNTAVGVNSLNANTTGSNNTTLGSKALKENTTASFNTAIGSSSLQNNTTGSNNTALGYLSLNANTTGTENTSIGATSLLSNTQGQYNTAIGNKSLQTSTTGVNNTAVGYGALQLLTIGGGNVAIGYGSGSAITTGSNNYLLGGGQAITTGSNNTIIGSYGGTSTLANNIVLSDGQSNVRLFSDANGLIGINQSVGSVPGGQLDIHSTQTYALVLNGLSTSNAYTAFSNASVGKWRIGNTYNAGANSFDIFNLGTSSTALSFNSTTNAATFNSSITPGGIIYGINGNLDPTIGTNAGTTLTYNGFSATNNYSTGLAAIRNSAYDMFFQTGATNGGGYRFYIGTSEKMTMSNTGNFGIGTATPSTKLQVEDGYISTYHNINANDAGYGIEFYTNGGGSKNTIASIDVAQVGTARTGTLKFNTSNAGTPTERMRITSGGNVLIGTTTDTGYQLNMTGYAYIGGNIVIVGGATIGSLAGSGSRAVLADANGLLSAPVSDISVKENINTIGYGLNEILKMNPVWFNYNDEYKNYGEGRQNGNIAQEMETIIPEAVFTTPSTGKMGINYDQLHAVYIKAIQELNEKLIRNNIN